MAERTEDLTLPNAVIARIIKDSLPEGVSVSKEARSAIAKSASVFVLYATSTANNLAQKNKKKTLSGQDVLTAMKEMEFERFIEPLQESLEVHKRSQQSKKEQKEAKAKAKKAEEEKKKDLEDGNTPMEQDSVPSIATEVEKETELDGTL